jgi:hypothetical protein
MLAIFWADLRAHRNAPITIARDFAVALNALF